MIFGLVCWKLERVIVVFCPLNTNLQWCRSCYYCAFLRSGRPDINDQLLNKCQKYTSSNPTSEVICDLQVRRLLVFHSSANACNLNNPRLNLSLLTPDSFVPVSWWPHVPLNGSCNNLCHYQRLTVNFCWASIYFRSSYDLDISQSPSLRCHLVSVAGYHSVPIKHRLSVIHLGAVISRHPAA